MPTLVAGFATIYVIWGSTYLGIRFAVETLPPFLMAGFRFVLAGTVLYAFLRLRGRRRPSAADWRAAAVTGTLLLVGGNGTVTWGEKWVPSGTAALLAATTPLWMVVLGWLCYSGARPGPRVVAGLVLGFAGAALLVRPSGAGGAWGPTLAIAAAPALWSLGTLQTRKERPGADPLLFSAMQMLVGGGAMLLGGTALGEWPELAAGAVSARSALAFAYLTVFGSLVAFNTYTWLIRVASPTAVSTHAYVNPLVAVLLGWLLGGETVGANLLWATPLVVGAVALITLRPAASAAPARTGVADLVSGRRAPARASAARCAEGKA
jgi:drug/metabolite transporter (DMT)-like permease